MARKKQKTREFPEKGDVITIISREGASWSSCGGGENPDHLKLPFTGTILKIGRFGPNVSGWGFSWDNIVWELVQQQESSPLIFN
jgi:hypothetical protein